MNAAIRKLALLEKALNDDKMPEAKRKNVTTPEDLDLKYRLEILINKVRACQAT